MPIAGAPQPWQGLARMGLGWGWFKGMAGDNQPHAHHAIQILIAESPQSVWTVQTGWISHTGIMIGANVRHQLAPTREPVSLFYIEPDSDAGQALSQRVLDAVSPLTAEEIQQARRRLGDLAAPAPDQWLASMLAGSRHALPERQRDELIHQIMTALPTPLPERLAATELAGQAGLSLSRFQHRFRAHAGMALRPYLRWRRLLHAMAALMQGEAITDAALAAGFSDAAHFTRTVRRHFGIAPRALSALRGA
jgi:AraC-like DNA-binding protein